MLGGCLKRFCRFVKQILLKIVKARSSFCFRLLKLISNNHFYITNFTNTLCSVNVSVSVSSNINGLPINFFDKNFNFNFCNSRRLPYEVKKYQKSNLLGRKRSNNSGNMNIVLILFIFLISFHFLRKEKNSSRLKVILTSIAFLVCILCRSSNPQNRLTFFFMSIFYP